MCCDISYITSHEALYCIVCHVTCDFTWRVVCHVSDVTCCVVPCVMSRHLWRVVCHVTCCDMSCNTWCVLACRVTSRHISCVTSPVVCHSRVVTWRVVTWRVAMCVLCHGRVATTTWSWQQVTASRSATSSLLCTSLTASPWWSPPSSHWWRTKFWAWRSVLSYCLKTLPTNAGPSYFHTF